MKNAYGFEISLYWITLLSTYLSLGKMAFCAFWTYKPIQKQIDKATAIATFAFMFSYRMVSWVTIITMLHCYSALVFIIIFACIYFYLAKVSEIKHEKPAQLSLVSLIFPVYKLPSAAEVPNEKDLKTLFWLGAVVNILLMFALAIVFALYKIDVTNPWHQYYKIFFV